VEPAPVSRAAAPTTLVCRLRQGNRQSGQFISRWALRAPESGKFIAGHRRFRRHDEQTQGRRFSTSLAPSGERGALQNRCWAAPVTPAYNNPTRPKSQAPRPSSRYLLGKITNWSALGLPSKPTPCPPAPMAPAPPMGLSPTSLTASSRRWGKEKVGRGKPAGLAVGVGAKGNEGVLA